MGFFVSRHLGLLLCNIAIMKRLLFITCLLLINGCQKQKNGLETKYWGIHYNPALVDKETKMSEYNYQNDTLHGVYTLYNISGKRRITGNYSNGLEEGVRTYYYNNGNIFGREIYVGDQSSGEFTFFDRYGKKYVGQFHHSKNIASNYIDDIDDGTVFNKDLKELDIKEDGNYFFWHQIHRNPFNQNYRDPISYISAYGEFRHGKLNGKYILFNEVGYKRKEGRYFDPNTYKVYKNGTQQGEQTVFYKNGVKKSKVDLLFKYKIPNIRTGKIIKWHENGRKQYEGNYKNGKMFGRIIKWHDNGQLASVFFNYDPHESRINECVRFHSIGYSYDRTEQSYISGNSCQSHLEETHLFKDGILYKNEGFTKRLNLFFHVDLKDGDFIMGRIDHKSTDKDKGIINFRNPHGEYNIGHTTKYIKSKGVPYSDIKKVWFLGKETNREVLWKDLFRIYLKSGTSFVGEVAGLSPYKTKIDFKTPHGNLIKEVELIDIEKVFFRGGEYEKRLLKNHYNKI